MFLFQNPGNSKIFFPLAVNTTEKSIIISFNAKTSLYCLKYLYLHYTAGLQSIIGPFSFHRFNIDSQLNKILLTDKTDTQG